MHLDHAALWTGDLERARAFYTTYFNAVAGERYHNPSRQFTSYFLSFPSGARLELMQQPTVTESLPHSSPHLGYAHLAFATGSQQQVQQLTERLRSAGYAVVGEPRRTGDGYYESVVLDPDGNLLEITV
ncbi:VOC family protein [Hymenobacter wooponensis]|uniref:Glyoxalase/bleomycin resistance/extradiol dioxygenase family protein n=1 Tax=Hymenobacter wooponensis TaxID=1525360 RepID=A0A4Z0ME81_9BACT|nr:VOC family protein [Hymenobacter wooponensis]TGD77670.1 glyoxalase/bleomycin resistance/extradiol dioxygenase family protein [Hymenobacter wooponensis]